MAQIKNSTGQLLREKTKLARSWVSEPLVCLLRLAGLRPADVDEELHKRIHGSKAALLGYSSDILMQIRAATDIDVVAISRKHHRLLVAIEQRHRSEDTLQWTYRERSRNRCVFACRGSIPGAPRVALIGEALGRLVASGCAATEAIPAAIRDARIEAIAACGDGWLEAHVTPEWQAI